MTVYFLKRSRLTHVKHWVNKHLLKFTCKSNVRQNLKIDLSEYAELGANFTFFLSREWERGPEILGSNTFL